MLLGLDVPPQLETVQSRIQRTLARVQRFARNLANTIGDPPPVIRTESQDLENQQVERALEQVRLRHGLLS